MDEHDGKPEAPEAANTEFGMPMHTPESPAPASDTIKLPTPVTAADTGMPPALLERYEILGEAGSGGIGIVYKARDRETRELVALKILRPEVAAVPGIFERFLNELRLARKITHKNVCRIHDFIRVDGTTCISMEFVEGDSLRQVLGRFGNLGARKARQIAQQICAGLREAHAQAIVHRDLKPENIMLDRSGHVKIMDFGIARSADTQATQMGAVVGTPAYMAPEQAEGKPADARADIYALGLILYEVLTGKRAFSGDTPVAIAVKQIRQKPLRPRQIEPGLSAHLEAVVLKCLEKDLSKRFQSVDELETALLAPGTVAPPPMLRRGGRAAVGVAALVVVALGGFGLGWKLKPAPASQPLETATVGAPDTSAGNAQPASAPTASASKEPAPPKPQAETARHAFTLRESAQFTEVGPVSIRLNKADPKRQLYTVTVQMKNRVEMRDRALLEPVRFYHDQSRHMLELVVSKIEDDQVTGYLIAPKSPKGAKPTAESQPSPGTKRPMLPRLLAR